jgi:hyperosmotically inducible protein
MLNKNKLMTIASATLLSTALLASCSTAHHHESTGQYIDSATITSKVKMKLLADKEVNGLPISVKTYKNTVQLSGFVNTPYQRLKAEEIAKTVPGVEYVEDSLLIKHR